MRLIVTSLAALLAGAALLPAQAQPDAGPGMPPGVAARLSAERVGAVESGLYSAGDDRTFILAPYGRDKYLLRFTGSGERFVLSVDRGSLGARLLKYDTGTTALRISVWGGLTLYTQEFPGGMPATRQADAPAAMTLAVSAPELQTAFNDETGHLSYSQKVALKFSADPAVLAADPETRGRAFDALTNAAVGIERFLAATPSARPALSRRINSVKVAEGGKPTISITGQTLLVSFVPSEGHEGHASSLAIQQELGKLLTPTTRDVATK